MNPQLAEKIEALPFAVVLDYFRTSAVYRLYDQEGFFEEVFVTPFPSFDQVRNGCEKYGKEVPLGHFNSVEKLIYRTGKESPIRSWVIYRADFERTLEE